MKKIVALGVILALSASTAGAFQVTEDPNNPGEFISYIEEADCLTHQGISEKVMLLRQMGETLAAQVEMVNSHYPDNHPSKNLVKQAVITAYDIPVFSSPEVWTKAAKEHGNQHYAACLKFVAKQNK
jgi:hypothetical protein